MNIATGAECLDERWVVREVGEEAQLDLRVICRDERPPTPRNEPPADVAAELTTNRNVLKVRFARRKATRRGGRLTERRVDPTRARMDVRGKRVNVGALEFR